MSTPVEPVRLSLVARLLPVLLTVVAVVSLAVGGWWLQQAHELRSVPAADNDALVDSTGTAEVEADVSQALTRVLSFDYAKPEATEESAKQYLRGDARDQYDELFAALQASAPDDQLVLTAAVRTIGVSELQGDKARLLVFLDQTSTRASDKASSVAAAQVAITAQKVDGSWRVTGLQPL